MYFAEPEATTGGRGLECARGRIVGGSSSIHAMAYVRGHAGDYDRWAASGLVGWSFAEVLPYFQPPGISGRTAPTFIAAAMAR